VRIVISLLLLVTSLSANTATWANRVALIAGATTVSVNLRTLIHTSRQVSAKTAQTTKKIAKKVVGK
jgi:hypothetical protein